MTTNAAHRQSPVEWPPSATATPDGYVIWKGWHDADFGRVDHDDAIYFQRELHASGVRSVAGLKVGELGYGNGTFAGWVRGTGGHWIGREVIPDLQARATRAGFHVIAPDAEFSDTCESALDVIVAFDVVEHLELSAIRSFLRDAKAALKPSGLLVIRAPSGDSPFSSAIYHGDLTHRTLLGSSAVRQLASEIGLEVTQIRPPILPTAGLPTLRRIRRTAVQFAQTMTFGFIRYFLIGNEGAVLSPNMIVVLARGGER
jgi:hypothetical protein